VKGGRGRGVVTGEDGHEVAVGPAVSEGGDVHEDEDDAEVAGEALERVAPVVGVSVFVDVGLAGEGEEDADEAVEEDRQEEAAPFDEWERGEVVDEVDLVLEHLNAGVAVVICSEQDSPCDGRVGDEVETEEETDRDQAEQRVESAEREVVSIHE